MGKLRAGRLTGQGGRTSAGRDSCGSKERPRPFPSRASRKRRITKIKGSDLKAWIILDPEIVLVYRLKRRSWRRREAIIVSVMRTEEIADEAAKEALLRRYS